MIVKQHEALLLLSAMDVMDAEIARLRRERQGRKVGYSNETLIKIAEIGDQVSETHARQVPKKWTAEKVRSVLSAGRQMKHALFAAVAEIEVPTTGEDV